MNLKRGERKDYGFRRDVERPLRRPVIGANNERLMA